MVLILWYVLNGTLNRNWQSLVIKKELFFFLDRCIQVPTFEKETGTFSECYLCKNFSNDMCCENIFRQKFAFLLVRKMHFSRENEYTITNFLSDYDSNSHCIRSLKIQEFFCQPILREINFSLSS